MKKAIVIIAVLAFAASTAFAAPFTPTLLKLSAAKSVKYDFDGKTLTIPVTATGTEGAAVFCVYTKDKGATIKNVTNGYLGWHNVNLVDTSIYISKSFPLTKGTTNVTWDGKDDDGKIVPAGTYTYYLFAYDDKTPKTVVNKFIMNAGGSGGKIVHMQEWGPDGKALAQPVFYSRGGTYRWVLGGDPADSMLTQTTSYTLASGFGASLSICLQPDSLQYFFVRMGNATDKVQGVRKFAYVPNGVSQTTTWWGDKGWVSWLGPDGGGIHAGPNIIGDYLWSSQNGYYQVDKALATLQMIDWKTGSLEQEVDVSDWWSDVNDSKLGQMNGGPNGTEARNGKLYLNCHCSCIKQMVDPAQVGDKSAFYLWTNQNGDYIVDHNYEAGSAKAWVCNDYKVGPYTYHVGVENNGFNVYPIYDMGAVSFGLLGPDGDGIGNFAYSGDTAGWKWWNVFVDNDGAYDGLYCDDNQKWQGALAAKIPGIYYVANDSFKGVISNQIGVADAAPAAFTVAQNSPNPFNPSTTITFSLAKAGKVSIDVFNSAGQKVDTIANANMTTGSHSVVWNASKFSAGVYFYTVKAGGFSKTLKMTLLK